nr:FAD-dependent monooxygenase [Ktedonobacteraceae bacterium]
MQYLTRAINCAGRDESGPYEGKETAVLVVGGGPVGLSAAIELGQRGVQCLIVEPRLAVSRLRPRAKTTNIRT